MKIFICMFLAAIAFAAKPAQPVALKSPQLEVIFDPLKGLPVEYRLTSNKATLRGGADSDVGVTIFKAGPRTYTTYAVRPEVIRAVKNRADFQFTVREKGAPMASFMLRYELTGGELMVSLEAVLEEQGFELIDVALPELASVREEDGGAWLAHGDGGGVTAMVNKAKPGHLPHEVAATLPVVMIGSNRMLCVEEVLSLTDTTELSVDHRAAALGTIKMWRRKEDAPSNSLIGGRPLCRLDFLADMDHNGAVDWLDGAKEVRSHMPQIANHEFDDKLTYMIDCRDKPDVLKIIQRVETLTGGASQVVYLSGCTRPAVESTRAMNATVLPFTESKAGEAYDDFRYAALGKLAAAGNGPSGEISPFGGEAIPLAATIYRKSAIWGMRGEEWKKQPELSTLFYNGRDFPQLPSDDWERQFKRFYYGSLVPWYQIHYRNIEAYLRDGDRVVISLEGNSKIDLDWKTGQYAVTVDGVDVARDGDTFCPVGKDRVAFYSPFAKQLSAPLPEGWDSSAVAQAPATVSVRDGKLTVAVQAEQPVMVFRNAAALQAARISK
jgi:hypothetical protein